MQISQIQKPYLVKVFFQESKVWTPDQLTLKWLLTKLCRNRIKAKATPKSYQELLKVSLENQVDLMTTSQSKTVAQVGLTNLQST